MNEFDYDALQKKRIARSASKMKRGSRSKKCTLPSDHLTPAQLKKKNGDVVTVSMNKPMKWEEFKSLSKDLKTEYIKKCVETFDCTVVDLALMFGCHQATVRRCVADLGLNSLFKAGRKLKAKKIAFREWLENEGFLAKPESENEDKSVFDCEQCDNAPMPCDEAPVACDPPLEEIKTREIVKSAIISPVRSEMMSIPHMALEFIGILNPDQITNTLLSVAKGKNVRVRVVIEEAGN